MFNTRNQVKVALISFFLVCSFVFATDYYMQNFFPIGFTGFEHTGYWGGSNNQDGSPYPDGYEYGTWAAESLLLAKTKCNFIGCADACQQYYLLASPSDTLRRDFYNKVCLPSGIMLATNLAYTVKRVDMNGDGDINDLNEHYGSHSIHWSTIFRSYNRGSYGGPPFALSHRKASTGRFFTNNSIVGHAGGFKGVKDRCQRGTYKLGS